MKITEVYITNLPTYHTQNKTKIGVYSSKKFESSMMKPWQLKLDQGEFLVDTNDKVLTMKDWWNLLERFKIIKQ